MTTAGWIFMLTWWGGLIIVALWCFLRLIAPDKPTGRAPSEPTPRD